MIAPRAPLLRRADLRFLLAALPSSAAVLGALDAWAEALARTGVEIVDVGQRPDVVIAPGTLAREAAAVGADQLLLEGPVAAHPLHAHGYGTRRVAVLPCAARPELVVPLDDLSLAMHAVAQRSAADRSWRRFRQTTGIRAGAVGRGRALHRSVVTVASKQPSLPFALNAATRLGIPSDASWYLALGRGDELQRAVFLVAVRGVSVPSWAVKVARVSGLDARFDREAEGLELVKLAGPRVAARAPRLIGRGQVDGLAMSVETAAVGERLADLLRRDGPRQLRLIRAVTRWTIELGQATRGHPAALRPELDRLRADLASVWDQRIDLGRLLALVRSATPVTQHNDLATRNIVAAGESFTVVDWEHAAPAGLPLWDLLLFLADASAHFEGQAGRGQWARHAAALFRGEALLSPLVFGLVRGAADAMDLPAEAVGPIATLGWMDHGSTPLDRAGTRGELPVASWERSEVLELADRWLDDPALGPGWVRWRATWNR